MHPQDVGAPLGRRHADRDNAVKAPGTCEGAVQDVGPIGGRDYQDTARSSILFEAVHLGQQLVDGLVLLGVGRSGACTTLTSDAVDLVYEYNTRRLLLGLLEDLANASGPDAHEHLDELGARRDDHGDLGFASDGACEERLAAPGRAAQQDAFWHFGP